MIDYQKYINGLRKCAKEHENDRTSTGHVIVSDLCRDTANLLEELSGLGKPTSSTTKNDLVIDTFTHEIETKIEYELLKRIREARAQVMPQEPVIRDNGVKNELNRVKNELEPTTKNCKSCENYGSHDEVCNYCYKCSLWTEKEPIAKNNLAVDCIDRAELLKAMNTYDKFGNDSNERLIFLSTPALQDRYVPYVHYDDMVNCVKGMSSVTPIRSKGHWIKTPKAVMGEGYMWYCDKCEYQVYQDSSRDYPSERYCPNCGADMRENKG